MKKLKIYSITKQDIQDALQSVLREFKDIEKKGIHCPVPYSKISPHVEFTRGTKNLGQCHIQARTGEISIFVGRKYLSGYLSPESLRATLIHEVIHTLPGCQNHGPDFQYWAKLLSREMNTDIGTYASNEESVQGTHACFEESKNVIICVDCGKMFLHPTMAPSIKEWKKLGRPDRIHKPCCEKHNHKCNMLVIKYNRESLIDGMMCDESVRLRAAAWIKKHVPPKELLGDEPFVWTPEKVSTEYWWKDKQEEDVETEVEEPVLKIANDAPPALGRIIPSTKKRSDITGPFSYEQMTLF